MKVRNTFIIFIVSGFWHGANWTFIIWGVLNAIYFLPLLLLNRNRNNLEIVAQGRYFPTSNELIRIVTTFSLTVLAWIFFRAENVGHALSYIRKIFSLSLFSKPEGVAFIGSNQPFAIVSVVIFFILIEWAGRERQFAIAHLGLKWPGALRYSFYLAIGLCIFYFAGSKQQFIYFQF
jgi:D-alanyl-lipoteichoic acid acyltransferase DltB (MBOAT superfamily)